MNEVRKERAKPRGRVEVRVDECKGCSYCVEQCPPKVLGHRRRPQPDGLPPASTSARAAPAAASASTRARSRARSRCTRTRGGGSEEGCDGEELLKGNEAVVKGAILAGCRAYYGYPITPASEIAEAAARYMPKVGGVFLQAESEIGAINMVYGAAAAGHPLP